MARPRPVPPPFGVGALEALEDALLVGRLDPRALVGDGDRSRRRRRAKARRTTPPVGRMANGIADQVDQDLDDRALLAARRQAARAASSSIATPRSSADGFEHHHRFGGERGKVDRALALRRVLAHRANDREQVAGGGRDVVAVARIIAAQRAVGALDDPLGAFDDPVERRAQHLVERMVERRRSGAARRSLGGVARCRPMPRKPAKLPSAAVTTSPLRIDRAALVGAAARALAGESRGARRAR